MPDEIPDSLIERVAAELRRQPVPGPDFDARVMARVREAPPSALAAAWAWLAEPRAVAVSPLGGLAAAAGLAALVVAARFADGGLRHAPDEDRVATAFHLPQSPVRFVFVAPDAGTVSLAGDFNGWDPARTPLTRVSGSSGSLWTVDIPLAPGRYTYAFVVDGRRFEPDPTAPRAAGDDFGTPTSVLTVPGVVTAGGSL